MSWMKQSGPRTREWARRAECRGEPISLFFGPDRPEPVKEREAREQVAKDVCAACQVRALCLEDSLARGEAHGLWGGLTEDERRVKRRSASSSVVSAAGTMRRLRALAWAGHSVEEVALASGLSRSTISAVRSGRRVEVVVRVASAVAEVYPGLMATPPGSAGAQVHDVAVAAGWDSARAWAGLDMDDPAAVPHPADSAA